MDGIRAGNFKRSPGPSVGVYFWDAYLQAPCRGLLKAVKWCRAAKCDLKSILKWYSAVQCDIKAHLQWHGMTQNASSNGSIAVHFGAVRHTHANAFSLILTEFNMCSFSVFFTMFFSLLSGLREWRQPNSYG